MRTIPRDFPDSSIVSPPDQAGHLHARLSKYPRTTSPAETFFRLIRSRSLLSTGIHGARAEIDDLPICARGEEVIC